MIVSEVLPINVPLSKNITLPPVPLPFQPRDSEPKNCEEQLCWTAFLHYVLEFQLFSFGFLQPRKLLQPLNGSYSRRLLQPFRALAAHEALTASEALTAHEALTASEALTAFEALTAPGALTVSFLVCPAPPV